MKVINLYGGPGIGKSTAAAALYVQLKREGKSCELVTEFARDLVWDESKSIQNQVYILGNQHHRLWRVKADFVIMDSPLLLGLAYHDSPAVRALAHQEYLKYDNVDILLTRKFALQTEGGREQTQEHEVLQIDARIRSILGSLKVNFIEREPDACHWPLSSEDS